MKAYLMRRLFIERSESAPKAQFLRQGRKKVAT